MASNTDRLEVRNVDIRRGGRLLIEGLSFELGAGQKALVIGPNGGGKTSFLRVAAGLAPTAGGHILFGGEPVDRLPPERRARLAYRGHLDGLKKDLTVRENLDFYAAVHGQAGSVDEILDELGLAELADRQVRYLSAGQRRRTGLAVLRVVSARLWILDEPMTNLDASGRQLIVRWIEEHLRRGGLALVATHLPEELASPGSVLVEL